MDSPPNAVSLEADDEVSSQSSSHHTDASMIEATSQSSNANVDPPLMNPLTPPLPAIGKASLSRQQKIDRILSTYSKFAASSTHTDRGIKILQWTVWLLSQLTKDKYKVLSPSLRKFYTDLTTVRYVLRLYGMPVAIEGARSGSWSGGSWKDARIHKLAKLMAYSMVVFHPLEHMAFAQWTMPKLIPTTKYDGNKMSAWSCRFWLVFIFADWASSILKNRELEQQKHLMADQHAEEGELERQTIDKAMFMNKLQIVRNVFFTGPCLSWAGNEWATNPLLNENWCNGLSLAEAVTCMYQSIYSLQD
jgi:hypothetical protein